VSGQKPMPSTGAAFKVASAFSKIALFFCTVPLWKTLSNFETEAHRGYGIQGWLLLIILAWGSLVFLYIYELSLVFDEADFLVRYALYIVIFSIPPLLLMTFKHTMAPEIAILSIWIIHFLSPSAINVDFQNLSLSDPYYLSGVVTSLSLYFSPIALTAYLIFSQRVNLTYKNRLKIGVRKFENLTAKEAKNHQYYGVRGWLLFIYMLHTVFLILFAGTLFDIRFDILDDASNALSSIGSDQETLFILILPLLLTVLFVPMKTKFSYWIWVACTWGGVVILAIFTSWEIIQSQANDATYFLALSGFVNTFLADAPLAIIITCYLVGSKRVRVTFLHQAVA